ncbi:unnamed protein product [Mortierella alpina]
MDAQETPQAPGTQGVAQQPATLSKALDSHRPRIHITGSEALVWNVHDVKRLRQDHRIVGSLAGSLPRSPMQNIFQGLPLRLQPEEVFALWSHGLVELVDEPPSYLQPPVAWTGSVTAAAGSAAVAATETMVETVDKKREDPRGNKANKGQGGPETNTTVVHTRSDHLPRYSPRTVTSLNDITLGKPGWIDPPGTPQWQRRVVFMYLWGSLQFYLAPGMKFGGDYLLYRNDPLVCHAALIASVKDKDEPLSLTDLASSARLASTVQKLHLLCSVTSSPPPPPKALPGTDEQQPDQDDSGHEHHQGQRQGLASDVVVLAVEWAGF